MRSTSARSMGSTPTSSAAALLFGGLEKNCGNRYVLRAFFPGFEVSALLGRQLVDVDAHPASLRRATSSSMLRGTG